MKAFLRRRFLEPVLLQFQHGANADKLALSLAMGVALGVFPVLGVTTVLCAVAATWLRLNQVAIQAVNYLVYPLQLALYIPFLRLGARLFGSPPVASSLAQIQAEMRADLGRAIGAYASANLRAIAVWALLAPALMALLHLALRPLLARLPLPAADPARANARR
jgi:uncharacterized protein (DUF2062 family)